MEFSLYFYVYIGILNFQSYASFYKEIRPGYPFFSLKLYIFIPKTLIFLLSPHISHFI